MLIWVNGIFGVGKTQVAHELSRRLPGSVVSDPELLGFGIQRMYPAALREDFQGTPWWAETATAILADIEARHPGVVMVPMTLTDADLHDRIVGGLRRLGREVHHVTLTADRAAVMRRLRSRLDGPSSWAAQQFDARSELLRQPAFATGIRTDHLSITEAADAVADAVGITLDRPDRNPIRRTWNRFQVQWDSVRR